MVPYCNHYWSASTHFLHLRDAVRVKKVYESNDFAKHITERLNAQYDVIYPGTKDEFRLTEFFGSIGGIMVTTASYDANIKLFLAAAKSDIKRFDVSDLGPKYPSLVFNPPADLETLVILPGTNRMGDISRDVLRYLHDNGAYFKPHPLTEKRDLITLEMQLPNRVLLPTECPIPLLEKATTVVTTDYTELGLIAELMGKKHSKLCYIGPSSTYGHYFYDLSNFTSKINTAESGLFLPNEDWDEQIDTYLAHHKKVLG